MFCCTTLAQSSLVATLAPFNPNKVFASLIHYLKGGNRHSVFLLACGSLRLIGVSHFLYIYRPPTSLLSLSYPIALPCPFRSLPLRPTLMLRAGPDPPLAPFTSHRSPGFAPPRFCRVRYSSLCRQPTLMLRVDPPPPFAPLAPQRSPRLPPPLLPCLFHSLRRLPALMLRVG